MQVTRILREYIIGKNQFINSRVEFKRVLLTGYLSLLSILVNWAYMLFGSHEEHIWLSWLNVAFCVVCIFSLALIRLKKYTASKLILFPPAYAIVFIICATEPYYTGVSFLLVIISIGAIALFGIEQWRYSAVLSVIGAVIFLVAYVGEVKLWHDEYSETFIYKNFVLNFFVSLITSVLILYFMIDLNHYSEKSLEEKENEALEKNKELIKLNSELDRFVYSVSHDLRSPLATISGLAAIGKHAENLEEAHKYFGMIDGRIKTQDFFIREIIDFYRNSRTEINREPFSLHEQVKEIVSELADHESQAPIEYRLDIPPDLKIQSDKIRLRSVLSNLIGNAVKYHDLNKPEKFVNIRAERKNGQIEIVVEDNGLGIGAEHLEKVFDMFYRASADSKGSGLGLFIAKETVNKLGGNIEVNSILGKGSKFSFTISVNQPEA